ncbi:MAG: transcriptional regulator [Pseudomonadota bacterium]|nr:transcriptional regulator [Pseudomonadota bacterium]
MNEDNFNGIMAGLEDAIAHARGDSARGKVVATVDVKAIRKASHKTQKQFADTFHLPVGTIRDWEQHRRQPDAPARVLLKLIEENPAEMERLVSKAAI